MGESLDPHRDRYREASPEAAPAIQVLLVDDSNDDYLLTRALLRKAGGGPYELTWESTYESGLAALRSRRFHAAFLDLHLHARTGLEMLDELRRLGVPTPIIMMTGAGDGAIEREALVKGAADYLEKGKFEPESLERAIRHAIERTGALDALRASERRFRAVFDGALDGMLLWNDEGRYLDGNPAALAIFGLTRAELVHRRVGDLGGDAARFDHSRLLHEGTGGGEWEVRGPDGQLRVYEYRSTAHIEPGCHLTVLRDISSRRLSERMRERVLMSDRMASIGLLAAGVVHEINNPLTAVMAGVEAAGDELTRLVGQGAPVTPDVAEGLRDAMSGSERIRQIVRDLRLFSRAEEDRPVAVELHPVLDSSLRMAWNEIRHRARVVKHYDDDVPAIDASEGRLGQVFLNLLVNAAQAIPEGNVDGNEIRVLTRVEGDQVVVEIEDTGTGIPEEKLARIFEPFFTTKPRGVGTGLGLSICRGILADYKGELSISSRVGRGTVARVTLPVGVIRARSAPSAPQQAGSGRRGRVLIVDDEAVLVKLFVRALESQHDVTGVTLAREALAKVVAGERYDVILCDLMMPEMTGLQLHAELERVAPEMARRMVFLTGGVFTASARALLAERSNRRIDKPLAPSRLLALVRELLQ
jgi:PAS domain S-box-containing protein